MVEIDKSKAIEPVDQAYARLLGKLGEDNALKHSAAFDEHEKALLDALHKDGKVNAIRLSRTAHGIRGFHEIFINDFPRGTYYFLPSRKEEALEGIAAAIRPFNDRWKKLSARACLKDALGLKEEDVERIIAKVEYLKVDRNLIRR